MKQFMLLIGIFSLLLMVGGGRKPSDSAAERMQEEEVGEEYPDEVEEFDPEEFTEAEEKGVPEEGTEAEQTDEEGEDEYEYVIEYIEVKEDEEGKEEAVSGLPGIPESREEQRIHKVWIWQETGDCLWNLAEKYYGDPWKWKLIYMANQDIIDNPSKIYPKQELVIPKDD